MTNYVIIIVEGQTTIGSSPSTALIGTALEVRTNFFTRKDKSHGDMETYFRFTRILCKQ